MPKILDETIEAVNTTVDLVSLVEQYTHLERRGHDWWGCCPFHNEKTASFHVVPDKKMYYCFGCGAGGSTIKFFMEMEKLSFGEAVEQLAKRAGVEVRYADASYVADPQDHFKDDLLELYERVAGSFSYILMNTPEGQAALHYLENRQVSRQMIEEFKLGYAPADRRWLFQFLKKKGYSDDFLSKSGLFSKKHTQTAFFSRRIMFPIRNRHGQVVAFGGRILEGDGPKYLNSGEMFQYKKGETLFAFSQALSQIRKEKTVIFCEGYMDVIAFHQAGITNAVAPLGTALTEEQVKLVRSFADTVILAFDADGAGQKAAYKAIVLCRKNNLHVQVFVPVDGKDPAEILVSRGAEFLTDAVKRAIIDADYLVHIVLNRFDAASPEGKAQAAAFLFPYIDALESDIRKEGIINTFSANLGISSRALFADYADYKQNRKTVRSMNDVEMQKTADLKMNRELRTVLAAAAQSHLFHEMRTQVTPDDFEDVYAKDLFIVLEECYRAEVNTYDNLLAHCPSEELRAAVSYAVTNGEFAENAEKVVHDGVYCIKENALQRQKNIILRKLQILRSGRTIDEEQQINDLLNEKIRIDRALAELKEAR